MTWSRAIGALVVVVSLVVWAPVASAFVFSWFPLHEVRRHALHTLEGVQPRYQVHYFRHDQANELCVMLITDTQTGAFDSTVVPVAACD